MCVVGRKWFIVTHGGIVEILLLAFIAYLIVFKADSARSIKAARGNK